MTKPFQILLISLFSLFTLAACGQNLASEPSAAVPVGNETEIEEAAAAPITEAAAPQLEDDPVEAEAETAGPPVDPTDVSLVANTGRPQFLNSFATW